MPAGDDVAGSDVAGKDIAVNGVAGNDIVDLRDPESRPGAIHPRWDARVLTAEERQSVRDAPSPHRARWRLWAAKESAFKVARKLHPGLPFLPSRFAVELAGGVRGVVRHEVGSFEVRIDETEDRVHAVATVEGAPLPRWTIGTLDIISTPGGDPTAPIAAHGNRSDPHRPGARVRALAREAVGSALSLAPSTIEISSGRGVPLASSGGIRLPVDLSLSHHGRFLACAWLLSHDTG